jgi:hypothetical protein
VVNILEYFALRELLFSSPRIIMRWVRITYVITFHFGMCPPPGAMHLDGTHVKGGKFIEYRDDASGAAAFFNDLESVDESSPFISREVFGILTHASADSSWTTRVRHLQVPVNKVIGR